MPVWLLEYLLLEGAPQVAIIKIQFALLPGDEQLLELVNPRVVAGPASSHPRSLIALA